MQLNGTRIDDAACEVFGMWGSRLIVTADDQHWLGAATRSACGYGTSFIGCDVEAGFEQPLPPEQTPDGRPGAAMLFFNRRHGNLAKAVQNRTGQCLMTCPTTAVFDGLPDAPKQRRFDLGRWIRYFGDGYQYETSHAGRSGWAIPVMAMEFFCESTAGYAKGTGGAAIFICGADPHQTLDGARRAAEAIRPMPGVITPFPGGVCRAGSKVGARYHNLVASTNDAYCPTLRHLANTETQVHEEVACVYEIVINGITQEAVVDAIRAGIHAAAGPGIVEISAGVHGGRLTGERLKLREILEPDVEPSGAG
jgi:formylmethanofuran--tetrahydromethanopterin N-formyltransferase